MLSSSIARSGFTLTSPGTECVQRSDVHNEITRQVRDQRDHNQRQVISGQPGEKIPFDR